MDTYRYGGRIDTWGIASFRVQKKTKSFFGGLKWETIASWDTSKRSVHEMLDLVDQLKKQGHIVFQHTPEIII